SSGLRHGVSSGRRSCPSVRVGTRWCLRTSGRSSPASRRRRRGRLGSWSRGVADGTTRRAVGAVYGKRGAADWYPWLPPFPPCAGQEAQMSRPFVQLDVFAARPGDGNPLAVVLDGRGLDDATMQAIARWTRLPETTFVLPPTVPEASYRLRIFSPRREVPFAGHPSIGSAHAVLEAGLARPREGFLVQECAVGLLPIEVRGEGSGRRLAVRAPRGQVVDVADAGDARLATVLAGLPLGALPPVLMDGGRRWWIAEIADEATLRGMTPPWADIARLASDTGAMGLCAFARCNGRDYDL